uniref:Argininosuccinate lyase n=1 Tax=Sym plasmid TaxID=28430 RepID=A0A515HIE8_9ZZZZ|nr:Argininosuccinate lyase [Sym plasmid]
MTLFRRSFLLTASLLGLATLASAQGFPSRPLKIVYTYAPGGTGDVIARSLAAAMAEQLGQPVVVENKTGASGAVGTMAVRHAPADGHTLLVTTITTVVQAPMVTKDATFDPVKGLTPIANIAMAPLVLLLHQSVPANDFEGFVAWSKQQAKGVDIAVAGPTLEVATALLARDAKLNLVNVPFRGSGPALQSVLGGDTKVIFQAPSVQMMEFIKQGKLKVIGVTSAQPSPAVPGAVPLSKFVPGFVQDINFAIWAPPGTPPEVAERLTEAVRKSLAAPGMADKFVAFSVPLAIAGPDEVTRTTLREAANIRKIMETVPIKFE